jgi:hypothetical protein
MLARSCAPFLVITAAAFATACAAEPAEVDDEAEAEDELVANPPGKPASASLLPADYESRSAAEKQELLWSMVSSDEYCGGPEAANGPLDYEAIPGCVESLPSGGGGYGLRALKSVFALNTTFDRTSDELPKGRHKLFHPFGSVAKAELVATYPDRTPTRAEPYTGMLANTGQPLKVLVRLSPGGGPSFIPGVAVKFFVDGKPSVNTQAIESFEGQGDDLNYFHAVPSNVLPPPKGFALNLVNRFFKMVKREPNHLQLANIVEIGPDGAEAAEPRAPYQIQYRPHGDLATQYANEEKVDFRAVLRRIPAGTVLYDIYARPSHDDETFEKIAEIRTTSPLVASGKGDYQLFFKHHRGTN